MSKQLRLKIIRNCRFSKSVAMGNFIRYVIHRLRIFAQKGTHALDVSALSHFSGEKEILFGAGQQFTITSIKGFK